jgi:thioredoxin reductase (NADPH)
MPDRRNDTDVDCLVVGAGPAGLTAALYLRRFHRRILLVDNGDSRALRIPLSRNYPGFPDGITGRDILDRLRAQLSRAGGEVVPATARSVSRHGDGFMATLGDGAVRCRTLLMATGVCDNEPVLPGIDAVREAGLLRQCPICDGFDHTGMRIGVIGRGEHGVRETLFIRDFSDAVSFIALRGADDLDAECAQRLGMQGVRCIVGGVRAIACAKPGGVRLVTDDGEERFDVVYAALGTRPRAHLAGELGAKLDERGNIVVDSHCATDVPGLYAAGDVVSALDQMAVATGHAAIAATSIHNRLRGVS